MVLGLGDQVQQFDMCCCTLPVEFMIDIEHFVARVKNCNFWISSWFGGLSVASIIARPAGGDKSVSDMFVPEIDATMLCGLRGLTIYSSIKLSLRKCTKRADNLIIDQWLSLILRDTAQNIAYLVPCGRVELWFQLDQENVSVTRKNIYLQEKSGANQVAQEHTLFTQSLRHSWGCSHFEPKISHSVSHYIVCVYPPIRSI